MTGKPGKAGGPSLAMIASMNASSTAGFIGVSLAAAITSRRRAGEPFLKCNSTAQCRLAAINAQSAAARFSGCNSFAGSQSDLKPWMKCPASARLADQKKFAGRRAGTVVRQHRRPAHSLESGADPSDAAPARDDRRRRCGEIVLRRHPVEEWPPDRARLRLVEALEVHADLEPVAGQQLRQLAPMRVEQGFA